MRYGLVWMFPKLCLVDSTHLDLTALILNLDEFLLFHRDEVIIITSLWLSVHKFGNTRIFLHHVKAWGSPLATVNLLLVVNRWLLQICQVQAIAVQLNLTLRIAKEVWILIRALWSPESRLFHGGLLCVLTYHHWLLHLENRVSHLMIRRLVIDFIMVVDRIELRLIRVSVNNFFRVTFFLLLKFGQRGSSVLLWTLHLIVYIGNMLNRIVVNELGTTFHLRQHFLTAAAGHRHHSLCLVLHRCDRSVFTLTLFFNDLNDSGGHLGKNVLDSGDLLLFLHDLEFGISDNQPLPTRNRKRVLMPLSVALHILSDHSLILLSNFLEWTVIVQNLHLDICLLNV